MTLPPKTPIKSAARQSLIPARTPFKTPVHEDEDRETKFAIDVDHLPLDIILGPTGPVPTLGDSVTELQNNIVRLKTLHESLNRFNESFSALLHGLKMNAWCVSFPEAPPSEAFGDSLESPSTSSPSSHITRSPAGNETSMFITEPAPNQRSTRPAAARSSSGIDYVQPESRKSTGRFGSRREILSSSSSSSSLTSNSHHTRPSRIPINTRSSRTIGKKP